MISKFLLPRRFSATASAAVSSPTPTPNSTLYGAKEKEILAKLAGRSLLRVDNYSKAELQAILRLSLHLKQLHKREALKHDVLQGKSIAMVFQKRSTRTRVSTETGSALLGMHSLFLGMEDIQLGVNESLRDSAIVLSRFNSLLLARVFGHDTITELAKYSTVPVINALSAMHHPLQSLADIMTLQEQFGLELEGKTICWIGDGNNVLNDLMLAGVMSGMNIRIATPGGQHEPNASILSDARKMGSVLCFNDPVEALNGSDVIVTDTWVSMGQEKEKQARLKTFGPFKITQQLIAQGKVNSNWKFMHCLPRHEYEVEDEVFYSPNSVVFDEAENRMYTVMAVMLTMLNKAGSV